MGGVGGVGWGAPTPLHPTPQQKIFCPWKVGFGRFGDLESVRDNITTNFLQVSQNLVTGNIRKVDFHDFWNSVVSKPSFLSPSSET